MDVFSFLKRRVHKAKATVWYEIGNVRAAMCSTQLGGSEMGWALPACS